MAKIEFLKIFLILVAVLMFSAAAYGFWKINRDIDKITMEITQNIIQSKKESKVALPILPGEAELQVEEENQQVPQAEAVWLVEYSDVNENPIVVSLR